jgi:hypothetical protein
LVPAGIVADDVELNAARIMFDEILLSAKCCERLRRLSVGGEKIARLDVVDTPLEDRPIAID